MNQFIRHSFYTGMLFLVCACHSGEADKFSSDRSQPATQTGENEQAMLELERRDIDVQGLRVDDLPAGGRLWSSAQDFQAFWSKYAVMPAPMIDFEQERVVGIFLGPKPNPGYSVKIQRLRLEAGKLVVDYRPGLPDAEMDYPAMIVFPFHLLAVKTKATSALFRSVD